MVERVDEREGGGTIQGSTVVESGGDVDRRLVDIWYAEVDLPHDAQNKGELDVFMRIALYQTELRVLDQLPFTEVVTDVREYPRPGS